MMSKILTWLLLWLAGVVIVIKLFFKRNTDETDVYLIAMFVVFFILIGWLKLAGI